MALISLDKEVLSLKSNYLKLSNKIKLLEWVTKNAKTYNSKLIKKDKIIHKLKESIKYNFLDFGENMLPKSYLRISKQFPHLSIQEIIEFEKKVRDAGGSIKVHSGKFDLTERYTHIINGKIIYYMSWTCCLHKQQDVRPDTYVYASLDGSLIRLNVGQTIILGDLKNRSPISECHCSKVFYLKEEDEKLKDIKEVKVSDIGLSILHNINVLTQTIEEYSNKILTLKKLQENIELL